MTASIKSYTAEAHSRFFSTEKEEQFQIAENHSRPMVSSRVEHRSLQNYALQTVVGFVLIGGVLLGLKFFRKDKTERLQDS